MLYPPIPTFWDVVRALLGAPFEALAAWWRR